MILRTPYEQLKHKWRLLSVVSLLVFLIFTLLLYTVPLPETKLYPPQAYRFYDKENRLIHQLISEDHFYRMYISVEQIPPLFIDTLLLHEDQYFYNHPGVNPLAILRAAIDNLLSGHIVSGGSTITMQLARMIERRKRTIGAKLIESFRAIQLELRFTKKQILAHYLAIAPYGGNTEGLQAAAFRYFNKPATDLSIGQIALLVSIPKSPNHRRPDRFPEIAQISRDQVLDKMLKGKLITTEQYSRAISEKVTVSKLVNSNIIPHTAWNFRLAEPNKYVWKTTIDTNIQKRTHTILANYINTLNQFHISNAAAVVINNRTREVKAIVGSVDYYSKENLGANDGARTPRSPGSTLKPFLYGLAMQEGLISERTVLYDIPVNYSGYAPQNYSKEFIGPVQVREALTESLNTVAVELSNELGIKKLYDMLKKAGVTTLDKPSGYYGLPLVLGGVEIPLLEITNLYASLANGGLYEPYKLLRNDSLVNKKTATASRIMSKEAAWIISHILTDVERPDFPSSWRYSKNRSTIAWKTGTSYGHQDAWSVGYTPEYTIGVWFGNFDGSPSVGLTGSSMAAPLLFDLFQAIEPVKSNQWFAKPEGVALRKVCATCGTLASRYCESLIDEFYIKDITGPALSRRCDIPQAITIDVRNGSQAKDSVPLVYRKEKVFNVWPSEVATFLLKHGVPVREVPPYDINRLAGQRYYPPKILSPVKNTVYYKRINKIINSDHGIKLSAAVTNRVRQVFWFMDGKLIEKIDPINDIVINPPPGEYDILLLDDVGGRDTIKLVVKDDRELALHER